MYDPSCRFLSRERLPRREATKRVEPMTLDEMRAVDDALLLVLDLG
jgi:hypothetical protein